MSSYFGIPVAGTLHAGKILISQGKTWETPWGSESTEVVSLELACGRFGMITTGNLPKLMASGHLNHCMKCRERIGV